jgi:23S rRNA (guanosine2251-2'-O)-methyltransferase
MHTSKYIYGRNPVTEAIKEGLEIEKVFFQREITGEFEKYIRNYCKQKNIPLSKVPDVKLDNLSRKGNHQGVVIQISPLKYSEIEEVFTGDLENIEIAIVLDGITDVRNIGAIARSALAFKAKGLIMSAKGSGAFNEDAIKASSGALLQLPICREKNSMIAIEKLQQLGFEVLASDLKAKDLIEDYLIEGPVAIVLGSEDKGVSREVLKVSDRSIKIDQSTAIDSLNVSVAAGIILSELYKKIKI